jgi:hypothetical protein
LLCAFYGPLVHYDGELLATPWAGLWLTLTAWTAAARLRTPRAWHAVAYGALGALCLFTRTPLLPAWAVAGLAFLPWRSWTGAAWAGFINRVGLGLAAFAITALPFVIAVHQATGTIHLLPQTGGINLYIGNSPDPCATQNIRPGYPWEQLTMWPELNGARTPDEKNAFYLDRTRDAIREHPGVVAGNLVSKALQMVSSRELPRNTDLYTLRETSSLLSLLVWKVGPVGFPFGLALGFAVLGAMALGRAVRLPLALIGIYALGIVAIHVCDRYRLPAVPILLVVSGAGLLVVVDRIRNRGRGVAVRAVALVVAVVAFSSVAGPFCSETLNYRGELYRLLGTEALNQGHRDLAETHTREALRENPAETQALNQLGLLHAMRGELDTAEGLFREVLDLNPAMPLAWFNLARLEMNRGNLDAAAGHYEEGLRHHPGHLAARVDYARVLARLNQVDNATAQYQAVLAIRPTFPPARQGLRDLERR